MPSTTQDLYATLGVPRTASAADIKSAYKKLARKLHPDRNPDNPPAEARFKEVSQAYDVLSDAEKRSAYDEFGEASLRSGFDVNQARAFRQRGGHVGGSPFGGFDPGDFGAYGDLSELFGMGGRGPRRGPRVPRRGHDVHAELHLEFLEATLGCTRELRLDDRPVSVRIPAGVDEGQRIRLAGQGGAGPGGAGDLLITVHVRPHPTLRREGTHLFVDVPITVGEAMLGGKVDVPTLDGRAVVRVPPGSQSGRRLRLSGKGVPAHRGQPAGDLYAELRVVVPEVDPTDERAQRAAAAIAELYASDVRS